MSKVFDFSKFAMDADTTKQAYQKGVDDTVKAVNSVGNAKPVNPFNINRDPTSFAAWVRGSRDAYVSLGRNPTGGSIRGSNRGASISGRHSDNPRRST